MGIGRFAYTALLPGLQRAHGLDDAAGGLIASANLTGYLAGVLWARRTPPGPPRLWLLRVGLLGSVLTTAASVGASGLAGWAAVRFAAGVASGLVFVLVSAAVLEALPRGRERLAGLLFAGVGLGIALSGVVAAATAAAAWQAPWLLLGGAALLLALPALLMAPGQPVLHPAPAGGRHDGVTFGRLAVAYGLEGLGYIVSGTFAVRAVQQTPGLEGWAAWVWVAAGLAAAPSAALWGWAARRLGLRWALTAAFATQAVGMALPALSASGAAAVLGALFFGGTFIGIVTLTVDLARRLMPEAAVRAIGSLTAVYGVGQAVGPYLAGRLSQATGHPAPAVLAAAGAVALGALVLALPAAAGDP
ncbi:MAG: YbfB/YjiJ family MFS transporter [Anaeromyxobacter sp.]|nr:YbfB/YjiJ family MFS transporter [Anaeromyxobacter sp.]